MDAMEELSAQQEHLLDMDKFKYQAGEKDRGAVALVLDLAKAGQHSRGQGLGNAFQLPMKFIAGALRVLRAPKAASVRRMRGGASPDSHGCLARAKMELLSSTNFAAGRAE